MIFIYRNIKVVTYFNDHLPPHVHVIGPGFEVSIRLDTLTAFSSSAPIKTKRLAVELVRKNLRLCQERWSELREENQE